MNVRSVRCCLSPSNISVQIAYFHHLRLIAGRAKLSRVPDAGETDIQKANTPITEKVLHRESTSCVSVGSALKIKKLNSYGCHSPYCNAFLP